MTPLCKDTSPKWRTVALYAAAFCLAMLPGIGISQQHHHPLHLDFYRHWKQPGTGISCCDARIERDGVETGDCEPVKAEIRNGNWFAWLRQESRWVEIPDDRIIRERNPNIFDAHLCWNYGRVLCFVPPSTGG